MRWGEHLTICAAALAVTALLSACSHGEFFSDSGLRLPPPLPPNPEIVEFFHVDQLSDRTEYISGEHVPNTPFVFRRDRIFRSDDARLYQVKYLTVGNAFYFAQLENRQMMGFVWDSTQRMAVSRAASRTMSWEVPNPDATSGCRPAVSGFTNIFFDDNQSPAIGIWQSTVGDLYRIIIYAQDFSCPDEQRTERRFTTVLTESTPWRLAQVQSTQGVPPTIHLLSTAQVGEPIHLTNINIANHSWRGE